MRQKEKNKVKQSLKTSPRVIVSGGGTGGHIYPAIAIADEIKSRYPKADILFVGAKGKMEMEKVPKAGYPIKELWISGINRSEKLKNLSFPFKLISSLYHARKIIKEFKPDFAIGTGGFASGPTLLMASWMGIPYYLQEQNSFPGITNKYLSKKARKICVAYDQMEPYFGEEKTVLTGNPIRTEMFKDIPTKKSAIAQFNLDPSKTTILSMGGSLGSRNMNNAWLRSVKELLDQDIQLIWQTGKLDIEKIKADPIAKHPNLYLTDFIYNMQDAYAAADIIVSRAGAIAISELCLVEKAVILMPLPWAAEDHQTKNAENLQKHGAAIIIKDTEADERLVKEALSLCKDQARIQQMQKNISQLKKPNATKDIVDLLLNDINE